MNTLKVGERIPSQHLVLLLIAAAAGTLLPAFVRTQKVLSFSRPLVIHTLKAEPPRVAFDLLISVSENAVADEETSANEFVENRQLQTVTLEAGVHHFVARNVAESLESRKVTLQPMTFSHEEATQVVENRQQWVENLPVTEQRRVIEAQQRYGTLDKDWMPQSFDDLVTEKLKEIRAEGSAAASGTATSLVASKIYVAATDAQGHVHTPSSVHTADVRPVTSQERARANTIQGNIRYKEGLPSGPQWAMNVTRYEDGFPRDTGRYLRDGKFEIPVTGKKGILVAQLVDKENGQVIGEGSLRISENITSNPTIEIHKSASQVAVNFSSFYSHTHRLISGPVAKDRGVPAQVYFASLDHQTQTDQLGSAQIDQILKGSWSLVRSESKGYYPGIFLVRSGEEKRLPLFPAKMIEALKKIIRDQSRFSQFDENGSIVWGQVVRGGQPVGGAQINVESASEYQPIYFNSLLLPDPSLKATSDNGYFVVMNLPPGFHSLLASQAGIYLSHANVVTDVDAISVADMTSSMERDPVTVRVFDAFNGTPQSAAVEMQSLPEAVNVEGYATVNLSLKHQLSFARLHPASAEYMDSLALYDDGSDHVHLPLISRKWLARLQLERKINLDPEGGIVVGFVPSIDYDVYLPNDAHYLADQIVYFDSNGAVAEHGVAGGGFVLFNVKAGVQSIVVGDKNSEMLQTQVIPVDQQTMVTLKFH